MITRRDSDISESELVGESIYKTGKAIKSNLSRYRFSLGSLGTSYITKPASILSVRRVCRGGISFGISHKTSR